MKRFGASASSYERTLATTKTLRHIKDGHERHSFMCNSRSRTQCSCPSPTRTERRSIVRMSGRPSQRPECDEKHPVHIPLYFTLRTLAVRFPRELAQSCAPIRPPMILSVRQSVQNGRLCCERQVYRCTVSLLQRGYEADDKTGKPNAKFKWLDSVLRKTVLCMQCGCRHLPWELVKDVLRKVDAGCSWAGEPARTFSHGYGMLEFDKDETLGWYMHWVK